jgi:hypothetical protein
VNGAADGLPEGRRPGPIATSRMRPWCATSGSVAVGAVWIGGCGGLTSIRWTTAGQLRNDGKQCPKSDLEPFGTVRIGDFDAPNTVCNCVVLVESRPLPSLCQETFTLPPESEARRRAAGISQLDG